MTYQEFKDFLTTFLWKDGDTVLINNLDNLIKMGEATLSRELRHFEMDTTVVLSVSAVPVSLPADFRSLRAISFYQSPNTRKGDELLYKEPGDWALTMDSSGASNYQPFYTIENKQIMITGPDTYDAPYPTLHLTYKAKAPDFRAADTSWLADDFLDLLVYTTLSHTAPFLREDERLATWVQLSQTAINSANEESAHDMIRGQSAEARLPRAAGVARKGDRQVSSLSR